MNTANKQQTGSPASRWIVTAVSRLPQGMGHHRFYRGLSLRSSVKQQAAAKPKQQRAPAEAQPAPSGSGNDDNEETAGAAEDSEDDQQEYENRVRSRWAASGLLASVACCPVLSGQPTRM